HFTTDINWKRIFGLLEASAIDRTEISAVLLASQDHGEPLVVNQSMRDFRMKTIYKPLEGRARLEDLMFLSDTVPDTLPRHKSMVNSAKSMFTHVKPTEIAIMDSSPAVVYGASDASNEKELVVNVGNGHTIAVFFENSVVNSVYELHTGGVEPDSFAEDLKLVANRKLSHEETLEKGGHGIFYNQELESLDFSSHLPLTLIGPNRDKLSTLNSVKVHPGGSMMMAGPVGLIRAFNEKRLDF
ncbi:MAG: hypothetical protein IH840_15130, partial [Candidatus Heimdallarchaeota archaeon]|nr:hypothetical protein [Candidatus Heimdallarchaeota archaeon]